MTTPSSATANPRKIGKRPTGFFSSAPAGSSFTCATRVSDSGTAGGFTRTPPAIVNTRSHMALAPSRFPSR